MLGLPAIRRRSRSTPSTPGATDRHRQCEASPEAGCQRPLFHRATSSRRSSRHSSRGTVCAGPSPPPSLHWTKVDRTGGGPDQPSLDTKQGRTRRRSLVTGLFGRRSGGFPYGVPVDSVNEGQCRAPSRCDEVLEDERAAVGGHREACLLTAPPFLQRFWIGAGTPPSRFLTPSVELEELLSFGAMRPLSSSRHGSGSSQSRQHSWGFPTCRKCFNGIRPPVRSTPSAMVAHGHDKEAAPGGMPPDRPVPVLRERTTRERHLQTPCPGIRSPIRGNHRKPNHPRENRRREHILENTTMYERQNLGDSNRADRTQYGRRDERYDPSFTDRAPYENERSSGSERFSGEEYGRSQHSSQDSYGRADERYGRYDRYEPQGRGYREPWSLRNNSFEESYRADGGQERGRYPSSGSGISRTQGGGREWQGDSDWQRENRGYRDDDSRGSSARDWDQDYERPESRYQGYTGRPSYAGGVAEPFRYANPAGRMEGQYGERRQYGEPNLGGGSFGSGGRAAQGQYSGYATIEERHRRGPHAGRGPKNYQRSDERIKEDVSERLSSDDEVDASEVELEVKNGIVTLTGTVCSRREKRLAEDCCEDVSGVKDVTNHLRVKNKADEDGEGNGRQSGPPQKEQQRGSQSGQTTAKV